MVSSNYSYLIIIISWYQVFISNTNNLHKGILFQVFLYNTNNFPADLFDLQMGLANLVKVNLGVIATKW